MRKGLKAVDRSGELVCPDCPAKDFVASLPLRERDERWCDYCVLYMQDAAARDKLVRALEDVLREREHA